MSQGYDDRDQDRKLRQEGSSNPPQKSSGIDDDDDLDFVVTEAHAEAHELVGGVKPLATKEDDLGIESNSDLMEREAHGQTPSLNPNISQGFDQPIGQSSPPPPPAPGAER